jgi:hypothetical protein
MFSPRPEHDWNTLYCTSCLSSDYSTGKIMIIVCLKSKHWAVICRSCHKIDDNTTHHFIKFSRRVCRCISRGALIKHTNQKHGSTWTCDRCQVTLYFVDDILSNGTIQRSIQMKPIHVMARRLPTYNDPLYHANLSLESNHQRKQTTYTVDSGEISLAPACISDMYVNMANRCVLEEQMQNRPWSVNLRLPNKDIMKLRITHFNTPS